MESEAPILCLVRRGPPGQRGASLTPQSGAGRRRLPLELRAARLVAVVDGVVSALSGACGSKAHAGGNLPEFTDGRYRRRNLPFNSTPADDEVCAVFGRSRADDRPASETLHHSSHSSPQSGLSLSV